MRGELRKDPATGKWVLVRPRVRNNGDSHPGGCPFCPGNEHLTPPEIAAYRPPSETKGAGWEVRVFPEQERRRGNRRLRRSLRRCLCLSALGFGLSSLWSRDRLGHDPGHANATLAHVLVHEHFIADVVTAER